METNIFKHYQKMIEDNSFIDDSDYVDYNIKKGLRNSNGTGVIVGITKISAVIGYDNINGIKRAKEGQLYYRDYELKDLINKFNTNKINRFEQCIFLLLFSRLPNIAELNEFTNTISNYYAIDDQFYDNNLVNIKGSNLMNIMQRLLLSLYDLDDKADDISISNLVNQSFITIGTFTSLLLNAYHHQNNNFTYTKAQKDYSIAENILYLLRKGDTFTSLESNALDLVLVIHADHGGGNNSAFTTHVVSSTNTDTYSSLSASIGSLKGPKHGGANEMVLKMIADLKNQYNTLNKENIYEYFFNILNHQAFDQKGLIYGMGHAIYTISDPRAVILKQQAQELTKAKDMEEEFNLYTMIEEQATKAFKDAKNINICANVDLYSGLIYQILDIPSVLYTPLFALSRIASWNAHRIEQIYSDGKIIRPAYISIDQEGLIIE